MRWFHGHGFGWTPGVGDGQGGLACSPWGHKESDTTEQLNCWVSMYGKNLPPSGRTIVIRPVGPLG